MANSSSAIKRARQNTARRLHRSAQRAEVRTAIKKVRSLVDAGDLKGAAEAYPAAASVMDRMAGKNTIPQGRANRQKSRLNDLIKAQAAANS